MEPLKYGGLNPQKRLYLKAIVEHPGFAVQKELLEDAARQATLAVIRLSPEDENYEALLKSRQMTARITNDVIATLIKSIIMHAETSKIEQAQKTEESDVEAPKPLGEKFGSFVINQRKAVATQ